MKVMRCEAMKAKRGGGFAASGGGAGAGAGAAPASSADVADAGGQEGH